MSSGSTESTQPASGELLAAVEMLTIHSAERFEQIGALCETLQLLLRSPLLYESPWLAASQVDAILSISNDAATAADEMAERFGCPRDGERMREILAARAAFMRKLNG